MKIINFDEISSTNDYLKKNYEALNNFTIVKTNYQSKGRGQFERKWESSKNENLLFSILLKNININEMNNIKYLVSNTLINYLKKKNINGKFKEPNDILIKDKKILGILIETKTNNDNTFKYYIIGIGININQTKFNNLNATSFKLLNNKEYNIDLVFNELINDFKENLKVKYI